MGQALHLMFPMVLLAFLFYKWGKLRTRESKSLAQGGISALTAPLHNHTEQAMAEWPAFPHLSWDRGCGRCQGSGEIKDPEGPPPLPPLPPPDRSLIRVLCVRALGLTWEPGSHEGPRGQAG